MKTSFTSVMQPMKTHLLAKCLGLHPSVSTEKSEIIVQKCKKINISHPDHVIAGLFTYKKFKCLQADEIPSPQHPRC